MNSLTDEARSIQQALAQTVAVDRRRATFRRARSLGCAGLAVAVILVSTVADATARPKRGRDVVVARLSVTVDLDQDSVRVKSLGGILPGVALEVVLASRDDVAQTSTLDVTVRNDSDRTLVGDIVGELRGGSSILDPAGEWIVASRLLRVGTSSNTASWSLFHGDRRLYRMRLRLRTGVPLIADEGARIEGADGVSVEVPEFALPYEAFVTVDPLTAADLTADAGDMTLVGGAELHFEPTAIHSALGPPAKPMVLRVPAPQTPPADTEHLVALQIDAEYVAEAVQYQGPDLVAQYAPVAQASFRNGNLASATGLLAGIFHGGKFAYFQAVPRLWVRGVVRDAGGPRQGVIVRASHSPAIAITDATGAYTVAVPSLASVIVTALDPIRGQRGVGAAGVVGGARTLQLDITVAPLGVETVVRDGIRNGGFEADDLSGWTATAAAAVTTAPLVCTDGVVSASEGISMASIGTVAPDLPATSLAQPFDVPVGVRTLTFDYNVVSSEFTTGTPAPDLFVVTLVTPGGDIEILRGTTTDAVATSFLGDCGDGEAYASTGWQTASVDVQALSGVPPARVRLVVSVASAVDASLPTRVLVDNFRFGTLWVDIKSIAGANADLARAGGIVRGATQILRQAGINVRLRNYTPLPDPGTLTDLDITLAGSGACGSDLTRQDILLTSEMRQLLEYGRSTIATDLNLWLLRSMTGLGPAAGGYAISDDDFCSEVSLLTNGGVFLVDGFGGNGLAHEAGHVMLVPFSAGAFVEHNSAPGNFMLSNTPPMGVVTRSQSANINGVGAVLVQP